MTARRNGRRAAWLLALSLAMTAALTGAAAAQQDDASSPSGEFHRIFVPAGKEADWPADGAPLLPVDREEFERLVRQATERRELRQPGAPHIRAASYLAQLTEQSDLDGFAEFDVDSADPAPRILPLAPLSLAIRDAKRLDRDDDPPQIGVWSRPTDEGLGTFGLLVPESGRWRVEWAETADSVAPSQVEFRLRLPPAAVTRFDLDLPVGTSATFTPGRARVSPGQEDAKFRRWSFVLPATGEYRLLIRRPPSQASPRDANAVASSVEEAYRLTPEGLDYEATMRLEGLGDGQQEFRLLANGKLQITSMSLDGQPIAWRRDDRTSQAYFATLPRAPSARTLKITALASAVLDQPWQLPRVRAAGVRWIEGVVALWVDPRLRLQSIRPDRARVQNVLGVGSDGGEVYRLQGLASESAIEITAARAAPRLRLRMATVAELAERQVIAQTKVEMWTEGAPVFQASAKLSPGWSVDDVVAEPDGALAEWHVGASSDEPRLYLQFARSPAQSAPVTVTVKGQRPASENALAARIGDLLWLRFTAGRTRDHYLLVKDRVGAELAPDLSLVQAISSRDSVDDEVRRLLEPAARGLLLNADEAPRDARVRIEARAPRFQAEAHVELTQTLTGFHHRTTISCRPTLGAVNDLTIRFAEPLGADAEWTLAGDAARLVAEETDVAGAYRLRLPPRDEPFDLVVQWNSEPGSSQAVNPVVVEDAETWQSWAVLRGDAARMLVDDRGCAPAASIPDDGDETNLPPTLACLRLSADAASALGRAPRMTARGPAPSNQELASPILCWSLRMTTRVSPEGRQFHELAYDLEPGGAQAADFHLPPDASTVVASLDGEEVRAEASGDESRASRVRLPAGKRRVTVTIGYQTPGRPLGRGGVVTPPNVETPFRVRAGRWTVRSPADYVTSDALQVAAPKGLLGRLFGPLVSAPQPDGLVLSVNRASAAPGARPENVAAEGASATRSAPAIGLATWSQDFVGAPVPMDLVSTTVRDASWRGVMIIAAVLAGIGLVEGWLLAASIGAAATLALVVPEISVWAPQSALLGLLLGWAVRLVLDWPRRARIAEGNSASVRVLPALLLAAALVAPVPGHAEPNDPTADASSLPAVLMPVDDEGKPAGRDVYVPEQLYGALLDAAAGEPHDGANAALLDADYRLTFDARSAQGESACVRAELRFRWQTFQPGIRMELPLRRREAAWDDQRATLDGEPALVSWNADGSSCTVEFDLPGVHELSLVGIPQEEELRDEKRLSLHVPDLPGARIEAALPPGMGALTLPGAVRRPEESRGPRAVALLAPGRPLAASWRANRRTALPGVEVEQLTKLHVEPAAARVEVRLQVSGVAEPLGMLEVEIPSQLQIASLPEGSEIQEVETFPGSPTVAQLKFRRPMALPFEIALPLEALRTVSIGDFDYPRIRVRGVASGRRQLVVAVDPRLRFHEDAAKGLDPIDAAQVESVWGPDAAAGNLFYAVTSALPAWTMSVEPAPVRFTAKESLSLKSSADHTHVDYRAAIGDVTGDVFLHRLAVPPTLGVKTVTASGTDGEPIAVRWARPSRAELTVILASPTSGPHSLRVRGRIVHGVDERVAVPRIALEGGGSGPLAVEVRRDSSALVGVLQAGNASLPSRGADERDASAQLVASFDLPHDAPLPELIVQANNPQFTAESVIATAPDAGGSAVYSIHGRVIRGILDRLGLYADLSWKGPFVSPSDSAVTSRPSIYDPDRQVIELNLARPVAAGEWFDIKVVGQIATASSQPMGVPQIRVLRAESQRNWILIPPAQAGQAVEWVLAALQASPIPDWFAAGGGVPKGSASYLATRGDFAARQRVFPRALREAAVRVAIVTGEVDERGSFAATAELAVQPGPSSRIEVALPTDAEFDAAWAEGRRAAGAEFAKGVWRVPPRAPFLPRLLRVAYHMPATTTGGELRLQAPQVRVEGQEVAARQWLWRIEPATGARLHSAVDERSLPADDFERLLRRSWVAAVGDAAPLAQQLPASELANWLATWERQVPLRLSPVVADETEVDAERRWEQLVSSAKIAPDKSTQSASVELADRMTPPSSSGASAILLQSTTRTQVLALEPTDPTNARRWLAALGIIVLGAGAWRFRQVVAPLARSLERRPHVLGMAAGLFWWVALTPSFVGLVITGLAAASLARRERGRGQSASALSESSGPAAAQPSH